MRNPVRTLIIHASELATPTGTRARKGAEMRAVTVIKDAGVLIEDGVIRHVGSTADVVAASGNSSNTVTIDARDKTITPGYVDAHTHFVYGGDRADEFVQRLEGVPYMEIMARGGGIASTTRATRAATEEELLNGGLERLKTMLSYGVTTVEGKSGYGLDEATELKQLEVMKRLSAVQPVEIVRTFMGAHATPAEYKGRPDEFIDFMIHRVMPKVAEARLAEYVDIFCEKNVFNVAQARRYFEAAKKLDLGTRIHAEEIVNLGGAQLAAEVGSASADHLLQIDDEGIRALAASETIATLLPATAFCLREHYAPARRLIDSGCAVALASDYNPGSCHTQSIPLVISLAALYMAMSCEEILTALTLNGAASLGRADRIGSLEAGKQADLLIHACPRFRHLIYHVAENTVETVFKNGLRVRRK
jgi:imidazolonepropionase